MIKPWRPRFAWWAGGEVGAELDEEDANAVRNLVFGPAGLLPETSYRLELPAPFTDDSGRPLVNAASFPLALKTGRAPALAKFASAEFGVLERFAQTQGGRTGDGVAVLPLTVRHMKAWTNQRRKRSCAIWC